MGKERQREKSRPVMPAHAVVASVNLETKCLKVRHRTQAKAEAQRRRYHLGAAYHCPLCGGWHTTRNPRPITKSRN